VLVVSPHLDDGVFACGCLLAIVARRRRVVVATVFAGRPRQPVAEATEWDRAAGFAPGSDVVAARRAEDRKALAILGARPRWLPFPDSQYASGPRAAAVARRLAALRPPCGVALFPLGLFHSDHHLVRDAVVSLMRRRRGPLATFAYEDALYRRLPGLRDAAVSRLRRAGFALRAIRFACDVAARQRKARAVGCYASQLRALATPGRLGHADAFAEERYWRVEPVKGPR
jgi:LmbE family N-acetylglucosaminyl deacetylase